MSYLLDIICPACGKTYTADEPHNICSCGSPLLARYDMEQAKKDDELFDERYSGIWRYHKMLPVRDMGNVVTLGEGGTPVLSMPEMGRYIGLEHLYVKDEGQNPSASFKTRGASVAISKLKEFGVTDIVMDSGGNGAGAWSAYCKRGGLNAHIYMTAKAVQANQKECAIVGGDVNMCEGHTTILGKKVSQSMAEHPDWFDVRTMHEPFRVEGKKTIGYEIVEQFGGKVPDVILFPTAGAVPVRGLLPGGAGLRGRTGHLRGVERPHGRHTWRAFRPQGLCGQAAARHTEGNGRHGRRREQGGHRAPLEADGAERRPVRQPGGRHHAGGLRKAEEKRLAEGR